MYVGRMHVDGEEGGAQGPPQPPPPQRRPNRRHLGELQLIESDEEEQRMVDPLVVENRRLRPRNPRRHINRQIRHHPHHHPQHHPNRHRFVLDNAINMHQDDVNGNNDFEEEPIFQVYYRQPEQPHEVPEGDEDDIDLDDVEIDEEDDDVFVAPAAQEVPQNFRRRNMRRRRRSSGSGVRHMRICG